MIKISKVYNFYFDGFRNMTIGKTLWKLIFIKLLIILVFLKYFVHDTNFKTVYKTDESKTQFVYTNLIKKDN
ncbi:MAG: DUF4492 domain-containing protein [Arcobacter sp.]|nr:MAG: DUF4492 domain-containing protein [Arcobacter sp.]